MDDGHGYKSRAKYPCFEVGPHGSVEGKLAALIPAEVDGNRSPAIDEGYGGKHDGITHAVMNEIEFYRANHPADTLAAARIRDEAKIHHALTTREHETHGEQQTSSEAPNGKHVGSFAFEVSVMNPGRHGACEFLQSARDWVSYHFGVSKSGGRRLWNRSPRRQSCAAELADWDHHRSTGAGCRFPSSAP